MIPNANLFTNPVVVNTAFEIRRLEYDVGIGVGDDPDRAKALILQAVKSVPDVLGSPAPDVLVTDLAASAVKLRARWWIQPPRRYEFLESRDRVLTAIKRTLAQNGVDLPFETTTVLFHDQTEETDGDRKRQREGWPAGNGAVPEPMTIAGAICRLAQRIGSRGSDQMRQPEKSQSAE